MLYFFLELPLLLLRSEELLRAGLERVDGCILVFFCALAFLFELKNLRLRMSRTHNLIAFVEFFFELFKFDLVLAEEGALVDVLVDIGLVLDVFSPICELEGLVRLVERVRRRRDHRHHRRLAVASKRVL